MELKNSFNPVWTVHPHLQSKHQTILLKWYYHIYKKKKIKLNSHIQIIFLILIMASDMWIKVSYNLEKNKIK
jgi:hypothetical protein